MTPDPTTVGIRRTPCGSGESPCTNSAPLSSKRIPVTSSALSSVGYSDDMTLDIEFGHGAIYRYFAVPPSIFEALVAAHSKGSFFNLHVRNRFRYQRL